MLSKHHAQAAYIKKLELAKLDSLLKKYPDHVKLHEDKKVNLPESTLDNDMHYIRQELETANDYHVKTLELLRCTHEAIEHFLSDTDAKINDITYSYTGEQEPIAEVIQRNHGRYVTLTLVGAEPLHVGQKLYAAPVLPSE